VVGTWEETCPRNLEEETVVRQRKIATCPTRMKNLIHIMDASWIVAMDRSVCVRLCLR